MPRKKTSTKNDSWNLNVLYKSDSDPQIEADIAQFEKAVLAFEKAYRGKESQYADPVFLKKALDAEERLAAMSESSRAGYYFGLRRELDATDDVAERKLNLLSERLTKIGNRLIFFDLALGKLPKTVQAKLLADPKLSKYRYALAELFKRADHHLTEAEEKIMGLKAITSRSLWIAGTDKILNRKTVVWKGKKLPFSEAIERVSELPKRERNKLWTSALDVLKGMGEIAENEMTAIVLDKKTNDELRGFAKPYSATVMGYENSEASVEALIESVKKNYAISHRFYRIKARMLKEKKLTYADRNAPVGKEVSVSFSDATSTLRESFHDINPEYARILDSMLDNAQIDVYPKKGKTGGAFCASDVNLPTYVLLNYIPKMRALMTFAHEMGHAIHAERSKVQPPTYQGHSTAVAETASTLFENIVFDKLLATLPKKERIIALHNRIQDDISTIMRQTAFFEYEREMHERIRTEGAMNHEQLATLMQKHLKAYLGPAVDVTKDDGYSFVYVSHFRNFFYVYTYVYGLLVSSALAERLQSDGTFREQIDTFLSAGCSKSPDDIFKEIGVDVTKTSFFESGLKRLSARIDELETLI
jgi:oligoendopeptidase F